MAEERRAEAQVSTPQALPDPEVYLWVCPNCGMGLQRHKYKARCARCGFFLDCSDTGV